MKSTEIAFSCIRENNFGKKDGQHVWLSEYLVSKFGREQVLNFVLVFSILVSLLAKVCFTEKIMYEYISVEKFNSF